VTAARGKLSAILRGGFSRADLAYRQQLSIIMLHAEPLPRDKYLHRVAALLHGQVVGDGAISRACAQAQRKLFKAPELNGGAGSPAPLRKLSSGAPRRQPKGLT
jgi:hypothetical protein